MVTEANVYIYPIVLSTKRNYKMMMREVANSFCERIAYITEEFKNKATQCKEEKISLQMLQMGCDKMMSIISLLDNGIEMRINGNIIHRQSLFSPFPIARSLYELMLLHHSIFVNTETKENMKILINLWKIKAYKQRIKYYKPDIENSPQFINQKEKDNDMIKALLDEIKQFSIFEECKDQFEHAFETDKLGYLKINKNGTKISFTIIPFGDKNLFSYIFKDIKGLSDINNDIVYKYLSMNSHPSYLSLLQFHQQETFPKRDLSLESALLFVNRMVKSHEFLINRF